MRNNINREIIGAMRDFLLSDGSAKSRRLLRSAIRRECVLTTVDQVFGKITDETRRIAADHFESYLPKHPLVAKGVEDVRELSVDMCDLAEEMRTWLSARAEAERVELFVLVDAVLSGN